MIVQANRVALRTESFTESVIREMTRLVNAYHPEDGINLAQGFPDFPAPQEIKEAAAAAIRADINQYAVTWGTKALRDGIAAKNHRFYDWSIDPDTEITVCCGATEAMMATMLALINPGDEVMIFEPFYENYGPDCILCGAEPIFVPLRPPGWGFDRDELLAAITDKTRAIVLNSPNNPTGKVFSSQELQFIAGVCSERELICITDEIYEHITYDGHRHIPMATLPGMEARTVTINGMSKTFSVTGWRIGYVIAPPELTAAIRKVHDFLTVGAPAPLQEGGVVAMGLPDEYYELLRCEYQERRDFIVPELEKAGFEVFSPDGAYYAMANFATFGFDSDIEFADWLVRDVGMAVVPGSSFYKEPANGRGLVRFAFPKRMKTLRRAVERLDALASRRRA
jgi:aspartate/methionine/tyrosine aminotransferase